jgi:hypothetical protein
VQHRDRVPEAGHEAPDDLRGQPDLRDEHHHRPPAREHLLGGPQVDLGLARARHAVQEQRAAAGRRAGDRVHRRPLVGRQLGGAGPRLHGDVDGRPAHDAGADAHQVPRLQAAQGRGVRAAQARQRGQQLGLARAEPGLRRARARRHRLGVQRGAGPRALGGQEQGERPGGRGAVLLGEPQRELDELGRQRRVQHPARRRQLVRGAVQRPRDDPEHVAPSERHEQPGADLRAVGRGVVERAPEAAGGGDRLDLDHRGHRATVGGAPEPAARAAASGLTAVRGAATSNRTAVPFLDRVALEAHRHASADGTLRIHAHAALDAGTSASRRPGSWTG